MFANRLFTLFIAIALGVLSAFTAEVTLSSANSINTESKERAHQESDLNERFREIGGYIVEEDIASLSYLSRLNRCFDMPFSELASCHIMLDQ